MNKLVAFFTRYGGIAKYSHCELFFEDDVAFGINGGEVIHCINRSLSKDTYLFLGKYIPLKDSVFLLNWCKEREHLKISFSWLRCFWNGSFFGRIKKLNIGSKRNSALAGTYCSELLIDALKQIKLIDESIDSATGSPNRIYFELEANDWFTTAGGKFDIV